MHGGGGRLLRKIMRLGQGGSMKKYVEGSAKKYGIAFM